MRVFTHRITKLLAIDETPNNCWSTPQRGVYIFIDQLMDQFNLLYPGKVPQMTHPLDYTIILEPQMYIVGRYWGDETVLSVAQQFSDIRGAHQGFQSVGVLSAVFTCDDSIHPTMLTLSELYNGTNTIGDTTYTIKGYYLASDPNNFVSVSQ